VHIAFVVLNYQRQLLELSPIRNEPLQRFHAGME
jgi:hypothetical protein